MQASIEEFGSGVAAYGEERRLVAALETPEKKLFQVHVVAIGPECKELRVGDIAILEPFSGTMVTVYDDETQQMERLFLACEDSALALWNEE